MLSRCPVRDGGNGPKPTSRSELDGWAAGLEEMNMNEELGIGTMGTIGTFLDWAIFGILADLIRGSVMITFDAVLCMGGLLLIVGVCIYWMMIYDGDRFQ